MSETTLPPVNASPSWWSLRTIHVRSTPSRKVICPYCLLEIVKGQKYRVAWSGVYGAHVECVRDEMKILAAQASRRAMQSPF